MSQEELAKAIGLTFQQVQKYENGKNRITVSRLVDIGRALKTPLEFFYADLGGYSRGAARAKGFSDGGQGPFEGDPFSRKDVAALVAAYLSVKNPRQRKALLETAKAMAESIALK